jgi:competence protein ComEA
VKPQWSTFVQLLRILQLQLQMGNFSTGTEDSRMPATVEDRTADRAAKWPTLLRWSDQICCVGLIAVSLVWMAATWVYQGGLSGRLMDIERADRQTLTFQLDINQAEWPEWSVLPGIGETLAKRIVDARRDRGPFQHHEDLLRVPGIGPRILERIRPYLLPVEDGNRIHKTAEAASGRGGE